MLIGTYILYRRNHKIFIILFKCCSFVIIANESSFCALFVNVYQRVFFFLNNYEIMIVNASFITQLKNFYLFDVDCLI